MVAVHQRELPPLLHPFAHRANLLRLQAKFQRLNQSETTTFLSISQAPLFSTLLAELSTWIKQANPAIDRASQDLYFENEVTTLTYLLAIGHVRIGQHDSIAELLSEASIAAERLNIRTNYALYAWYLEKTNSLALPAIMAAE